MEFIINIMLLLMAFAFILIGKWILVLHTIMVTKYTLLFV